ncbi:hypothetical protein ACIQYG_21820 [Peribacillus sp. NPDC096622]|uniref:hypothetical protein n=1 Tax=Peribacillus sp. NPDC096622 TaxID=3364396 RepID=UPI00380C0059
MITIPKIVIILLYFKKGVFKNEKISIREVECSYSEKKTVIIYFLSIFLLAGCINNSPSESSNNIEHSDDNKTSVKNSEKSIKSEESEQNESNNERFKLDIFRYSQFIPLKYNDKGEYKLPDLELDNAGVIIFEPLYLEKSQKVTIEFQLQANSPFNHMTIGVIKDYSPDSNLKYEIEKIYSESIDNKLTVTYKSPEDSSYSICILGTMANPVGVKNGKIILN